MTPNDIKHLQIRIRFYSNPDTVPYMWATCYCTVLAEKGTPTGTRVCLPLTKDVFRQVLPYTKPLTPPPSHATPEVRRAASYCGIAFTGETEYRGPRSGKKIKDFDKHPTKA